MFEKIQKLGYKGANNSFAIYMWLIVEKQILPDIYYSCFHKKWCMNDRWVDTKAGKRHEWDYTDKPFDSYKAIVTHVVDVMVKLM